jgi:hypothetical protein
MNGRCWLVRGASGACLALLVLVSGCGTDVSEMASSVRDAATQGLEKAKETAGDVSRSVQGAAGTLSEKAGFAGSFDLTVGEPLKASACYATCVALGPNRSGVLQVQSYRDAESESFPSVFLRAPGRRAGPELAGGSDRRCSTVRQAKSRRTNAVHPRRACPVDDPGHRGGAAGRRDRRWLPFQPRVGHSDRRVRQLPRLDSVRRPNHVRSIPAQ